MEIPLHLKQLYKHWDDHIYNPTAQLAENPIFLNPLVWFVQERMNILEKKLLGNEPPFSTDEILSTYRFCNIYREFDRQTIVFHTLLKPLEKDFPLWLLNMCYCRLVARPETIADVGLLSFDDTHNIHLYKLLCHHEKPTYGTAYLFPISTIMRSKTRTREEFITQHLPRVIPLIAKLLESKRKMSVLDLLKEILPIHGYNHAFLWTEVLIDVAYQYPQIIDLYQEFPIGPGAKPTLESLYPKIAEQDALTRLSQTTIPTLLAYNGAEIRLSRENWEGICCEYRKYTNLSNGIGRKRIYKNMRSSMLKNL